MRVYIELSYDAKYIGNLSEGELAVLLATMAKLQRLENVLYHDSTQVQEAAPKDIEVRVLNRDVKVIPYQKEGEVQ